MKHVTNFALTLPFLITAPAAEPAAARTAAARAPTVGPVEGVQLPFELEAGTRLTFGIARGGGGGASDANPLEWRLEIAVRRKTEAGGALLAVGVHPESHDDPRPTEFRVMVDAAGRIMNLARDEANGVDEVGRLRPWEELAFALGSGLHERVLERGDRCAVAIHGKGERKSFLGSAKLTFARLESVEGQRRFHFDLEGERRKGEGDEGSKVTGTAWFRGEDGLLQELRYGPGDEPDTAWVRIVRRD